MTPCRSSSRGAPASPSSAATISTAAPAREQLGGRRGADSGCWARRTASCGCDQAALLEPAQTGGRRRPRRPAPADISPPAAPPARPLLDPSRRRRSAPPRRGGDLGPQLAASDPLPRRRSRRQHQLQAARGGRAVLARRPRGRAGPAPPAPRPRAPRAARRGAPAAARSSRPARRRRRAGAAARREPGRRCRPRGRPSPPAGGSRTGRAGRGRWSAARPWRSTPTHAMEKGGRRGYPARRWRLNLSPGEQVIFQGHPSWRAILGFYLKGDPGRGDRRRDRQALRRRQRHRLPVVLVDRSASPS